MCQGHIDALESADQWIARSSRPHGSTVPPRAVKSFLFPRLASSRVSAPFFKREHAPHRGREQRLVQELVTKSTIEALDTKAFCFGLPGTMQMPTDLSLDGSPQRAL